jgi:hypothetical protein
VDETKRRALSALIERAHNGDTHVSAAIEEMIVKLDRAGEAADVASALEMVATLASEHIYRELRAKLEANDHLTRQQWPMIG